MLTHDVVKKVVASKIYSLLLYTQLMWLVFGFAQLLILLILISNTFLHNPFCLVLYLSERKMYL